MEPFPRSSTPPRTAVAFRVGVTGHRPNRLDNADPAALDATIAGILARVREAVVAFHARATKPAAYGPDAPVLRVISPLAEGADRIVARHALDLGFELCCPMPFAQEEFERDFAPGAALEPDSAATFRGLLDRARNGAGLVTFELDGSREDASAAYGASGRVVVNQSDLLIVIWDGREPRGSGGTIQTMREAIHFQLPVLWVDAVAPHPWQLVREEADLPTASPSGRYIPAPASDVTWRQLATVVTEGLEWPPADEPQPHGRRGRSGDLRETYFAERRHRLNPAPFWKIFRGMLGDGRIHLPSLQTPDFTESVRDEWPTSDDLPPSDAAPSGAPETAAGWANSRLRGHFAWADRLADLYADKYRSSYVLAYPLAALAVILALFPLIVQPVWHSAALEVTCIIAELVTVAAIIGLVFVGKARRWHDRWMEYRVLAEVIRQLRVLIPLGGGRPFIRMPGHLENYGEPSRTWMFAFMRAVGRATGLPSVRVDAGYVAHGLRHLRGIVAGQNRFHELNQRRYERIEHTLHRSAFIFLALTVLAILLHLVPFLHLPGTHFLHEPAVSRWLTLVAAGMPALGSALAGISNQGEFSRVAKRSRAMAQRMRHMEGEIATLEARAIAEPGSVRLAHLTPLALHVVQLMVDENLEWRVVFTDRPPTLPA